MQKLLWCETCAHFCYHRNYKTRWSTMITWMLGGIRDVPMPRATSLISINTFSNIEQERVVYIFVPTSTPCTVALIILSFGVSVAGLGPISNFPITTKSISLKSQQYITFTLVMVVTVDGRRPISTSPFNINYCYLIARGIVAGGLWPISTSISISSARRRVFGHNLPTSATSVIIWGIVAGILIPITTTFMTSVIT